MLKKVIIVLCLLDLNVIQAKRMQQRLEEVKEILEYPAQIKPISSMPPAEQDAIKKRLDEQLRAPVENAWDTRVDDLFKLATVNPELARSYFRKMSEKMVVQDVKPIEIVQEKQVEKPAEQKPAEQKTVEEKPVESILPAGEQPMKTSTQKAPPRKFGPKPTPTTESKEVPTTQLPSGEEGMKISTKPAPPRKGGAPSGGPKKTLTPSSSVKTTTGPAAGKKEVAPKVIEQIFSVPKLQVLDNDKLMELFNDLLNKLATDPRNWNAIIVEKVKEDTKYGSKTYNVYGAPIAKWTNDMNTLKKVLVSKGIMSEAQTTKEITERIAQVRSEKTAKPVTTTQPEEKPQEALTQDDLVKLIKELLANPKPTDIGWVVSIKGNIKALDKINHDEALKYHDQFIKITKEKPFLK